jgi:2-polyprenyl-3-methyl-5-hydroxy-6-metoxy-1,4-benzoquinol methylase
MTCSHCRSVDQIFDTGTAERDLKAYRSRGPGTTTRLLIEAIKAAGIEGWTLLDIGGGVGVVQHELLKGGARSAIAIEASSAYLQAARQEAERMGYADRMSYHQGDFVEIAPQLPHADIVTLEKVICCYPDMYALVSLSSARAGKLYGVVFPRDTWWTRLFGRVTNLIFRLQRSAFRFFVHPTAQVEAVIRANGLERRSYRTTLLWQIIVYVRSSDTSAPSELHVSPSGSHH